MTNLLETNPQLRRMTSPDIVRLGTEAAQRGEQSVVQACIAALLPRSRSSARRGREALRSLSVERHSRARVALRSEPYSSETVFDQQIIPKRNEFIEAAESSIGLSSYTFPSKQLCELLVRKANAGVQVRLVVARKFCSKKNRRALHILEEAGVTVVKPKSTHSKVLVIDECITMNGSANAHGVHRDFCTVDRGHRRANEAKEYLRSLTTDQ